jgi:hypothetical protein
VLGGAIGLTIATIIFNQLAAEQLTGVLTPSELDQLFRNAESAYSFTLDKQVAVRQVFAQAFNQQLRSCTYVAAVAFVISLFAFSRTPPNLLERKAAHDAYLAGGSDSDE